jgi:transposase
VGVEEMISMQQAQRMVAEAVAQAVAEARAPLEAALLDAKRLIAKLMAQIYGTKTEASSVVLTAEGQTFIDASWGVSQETTPAPQPLIELPNATTVRKPRDARGLAQRHPHLPLQEVEAAIPAELADEVARGLLQIRRSGRHQDELVIPREKPFIRRVYEVDVVKASTGQSLMQVKPDRIIPGGDLADETIHLLVEGKMSDAMPFHRQLARFERIGVEIPKQTANDAINAWGEVFAPLADAIQAQVYDAPVVHADASWLRQQAKDACKRLHLWTVLGGGQVAYRVTTDQKHARALDIIPKIYKGFLVTDAWPGWFTLDIEPRLGLCNAHARRPFADWLKRNPGNPHAQKFIAWYRDLARIEHEAAAGPQGELLDRRRQMRSQRSRPIMDAIRDYAAKTATAYPTSHQLADGARYILDYWPQLSRFLDEPILPMDNNAAENALRINALIRKNSMFVGSEAAGHRDAVALTILHSCTMSGLKSDDYLSLVTPRMLLHRRGRKQDLETLTPGSVAAKRRQPAGG